MVVQFYCKFNRTIILCFIFYYIVNKQIKTNARLKQLRKFIEKNVLQQRKQKIYYKRKNTKRIQAHIALV